MRHFLAAMVFVFGGIVLFFPSAASADDFFERLFGKRSYYSGDSYMDGKRREEELLRKEKIRNIRVSSPRYYTYRPDRLKKVSLSRLAEKKVASAEKTTEPENPLRAGLIAAVAASAPEPALSPYEQARVHLSSTNLRAYPQVIKAITAHYKANPAFIWLSEGSINDKARATMTALGRAGSFGLSAGDYKIELPVNNFDSSEEGQDEWGKTLVSFEMELSAKTLTYVHDAIQGRVNPNRISGYHDLPRKKIDLTTALGEIAESDNVGEYLESRNPDNQPFKALKAELAGLLAKSGQEEIIRIAAGTFIKPDSINPELANVIGAIRQRASESLKTKHASTLAEYVGGHVYAPELVALVRDFQRENGLGADGIIGKRTTQALKVRGVGDKIDKVNLAMERLRWLPSQLGDRHVFINQPAYMVDYMHKGKDPVSMRVVVGKRSNQTSFFTDKLETVEYNPYWGVPYSIIVNEYLPKLTEDPSYLDRLGYEVTTSSGREVSSSSVDWYGVAAKEVSINVRQRPGNSNALGRLKILFPNKHAIYMHDTPSKHLFKRDRRAFSHGCVRLQKPRVMAAAVLGVSTDYISARIAEGHNDNDPVSGNIPVYVAYFTAWPSAGGEVRYYNDVYGRDKFLTRALSITAKSRSNKG